MLRSRVTLRSTSLQTATVCTTPEDVTGRRSELGTATTELTNRIMADTNKTAGLSTVVQNYVCCGILWPYHVLFSSFFATLTLKNIFNINFLGINNSRLKLMWNYMWAIISLTLVAEKMRLLAQVNKSYWPWLLVLFILMRMTVWISYQTKMFKQTGNLFRAGLGCLAASNLNSC